MAKRQVFFSFHYNNDNWRVAQVRNMGVVEDQETFSDNSWEKVRLRSDAAIKNWIDNQLSMRSCVVVLIGSETASRKCDHIPVWGHIFKYFCHSLCPPTTFCQNNFTLTTMFIKNPHRLLLCFPMPTRSSSSIKSLNTPPKKTSLYQESNHSSSRPSSPFSSRT